MPPIVSVVGKSNVGKTTLLEKLVAELKRRGRRVATVKHDVHGFELDQPGKDSWRHAQAGADAVVISSPDRLALIKKTDHDSTLDEIARHLGEDYDIIITEGYKSRAAPKIEVHRKEFGGDLLSTSDELIAVATDEPLDIPVWQCSLDDAGKLADLLEQTFMNRPEPALATLYADGVALPASAFVQQFVSHTVFGMLSALRGVNRPKSVEIFLRRQEAPAEKD
ncbi:MAG: molybdopterin-guanine dinucleotide biosynthesis protein B [Chloroflexi bacterium]|nr:molybdopterin-guanine dinucleotide biosynthesis protein B [Chloroflexota bacterium]